MAAKPILGYWDIRGMAQSIRYLLTYAEQHFEDKQYVCGPAPTFNIEGWLADKFSLGLDFPNLPYYIEGDVKLTQSGVILRYIARKHGLEAKTAAELVRQELLFEEAGDIRRGYINICYNPNFESLKGDFVTRTTAAVKNIDKYFGDQKWSTGSNVTFVDCVWYELFDVLNDLEPSIVEGCHNLKRLHDQFEELPAIKRYIASSKVAKGFINNKMAAYRGGNQ